MPTLSKMYVGDRPVARAYLGADQVWSATPEPLLFDDFERPDGPITGGPIEYTLLGSGWQIQGGRAVSTSNTWANELAIAEVPGGAQDYTVRAVIHPGPDLHYIELSARCVDGSTMILGGLVWSAPWNAHLAMVSNGSTTMGSQPVSSLPESFTMELTVQGNMTSLAMDGELLVEPTELPAGAPSGTGAGLVAIGNHAFEEWGVYRV